MPRILFDWVNDGYLDPIEYGLSFVLGLSRISSGRSYETTMDIASEVQ
jgi:hypothetical protein